MNMAVDTCIWVASYGKNNGAIPIDAYRNGLPPLIRRGDGGEIIENVFFETDEYTATLSGIRIVFGK